MTGAELDKLYLRALEGVVQPRDLIAVIDLLRDARAETARLQRQVVGHVDRIASQSEVITRLVEGKK